MAYDKELDERVAAVVGPWGATRKIMFGGTAYMLDGNLLSGVHDERVILRLSPEAGAEALEQPGVSPFDMVPRPMAGWVMVEKSRVEGDALDRWLEKAREFVSTLPPK